MNTKKSKPEFDLVIFGASGFTGRLVVEYVLKQYGFQDVSRGNLSWAIAGRSLEKLAELRDEFGAPSNLPLIVADASVPASLVDVARRTKVILTTVGPYQLYGSDLVAACAQTGTDYVDLCGEPVWMRQMIDAHHANAVASGARIVFSCGFDSIPFDIGVWFTQSEFTKAYGSQASRIKGRVRKMKGTFSGGTAASMKATMAAAAQDPAVMSLLKNPFALTPGFQGPSQPHGMKPLFDEAIGSWCAPFIMAPINTRNVHRSNHLMNHSYGEDFVYDEMILTGPGEKGETIANAIAGDKSMGGKDGPKPGEGPSKEERETGFYDVMFAAENAMGQKLLASVKGDRDPGYGSTSKMISESALCLLRDNLPTQGGIWTPAAAMAEPLLKRLQANAGLTFKVES
jgi:short subunit dehydrogenase-like uncharacterized protein